MNTLYYDPTRKDWTTSDGLAKESALLLSSGDVCTSNEVVVNMARLLVVKGVIVPFVLNIDGAEYPVNEYGACHHDLPYDAFPNQNIVEDILRLAIKKKKEARKKKVGVRYDDFSGLIKITKNSIDVGHALDSYKNDSDGARLVFSADPYFTDEEE